MLFSSVVLFLGLTRALNNGHFFAPTGCPLVLASLVSTLLSFEIAHPQVSQACFCLKHTADFSILGKTADGTDQESTSIVLSNRRPPTFWPLDFVLTFQHNDYLTISIYNLLKKKRYLFYEPGRQKVDLARPRGAVNEFSWLTLHWQLSTTAWGTWAICKV